MRSLDGVAPDSRRTPHQRALQPPPPAPAAPSAAASRSPPPIQTGSAHQEQAWAVLGAAHPRRCEHQQRDHDVEREGQEDEPPKDLDRGHGVTVADGTGPGWIEAGMRERLEGVPACGRAGGHAPRGRQVRQVGHPGGVGATGPEDPPGGSDRLERRVAHAPPEVGHAPVGLEVVAATTGRHDVLPHVQPARGCAGRRGRGWWPASRSRHSAHRPGRRPHVGSAGRAARCGTRT